MTRIDIGWVLRESANLPYTDLVTRPTGEAVRAGIERALAATPATDRDPDVTLLDFSRIGMMDYSCADEVVAKLVLALTQRDSGRVYVLLGITEAHLEALESVLDHRGLALVVHPVNGGAQLVGAVTDGERFAWEQVYARGSALADELARTAGCACEEMARILDLLCLRRLMRRDGAAYAPLGAVLQ